MDLDLSILVGVCRVDLETISTLEGRATIIDLSAPNLKLSATTFSPYFLMLYSCNLPFLTLRKFHVITKGPVEVMMLFSIEFSPVSNLAGVKLMLCPIQATCSGFNCSLFGLVLMDFSKADFTSPCTCVSITKRYVAQVARMYYKDNEFALIIEIRD